MQEKSIITEAFTELAPNYKSTMDQELFQFWGMHYQDFVEKMVAIAAVKPGEKVLDVATGSAVIPLKLKTVMDPQDQIVGLDITPAMLVEGQKDIAESGSQAAIKLVCASAMRMPFADKSFQVVTCGLGTHHMEVVQMLAEARRILADGGRLVISDVCATPFWRSLAGKIMLWLLIQLYGIANSEVRAKAEIDAYHNVRTTGEWRAILQDSGFGKVKMIVVNPRFPWFPGGFALTATASD
jgi:ubiquinone/menaquinone biosynthesis C-methylase UbiE